MLSLVEACSRLLFAAGLAAVLLCGGIRPAEAADAKATAETLLSFKGLRPGLCVYVGGTDAVLPVDLAQFGKYHVHCLTSDPKGVEKMRQYAASKGLYGQVVVDRSQLKNLPYPDNLINVLVVEDFTALQETGLTVKEIMRVVAPYSSALVGNASADLKQIIAEAGYKDAVINQKGTWTQIIKPWCEEMDEWPQPDHDPGCSSISSDKLVRPSNSVQWIAGYPARHDSPTSAV